MANTLAPAIPGTQWRNSKDLIFMKRQEEFTKDPKAYRYMLKLQFVRRVQPGMNGPSWGFGDGEEEEEEGGFGGRFSAASSASASAAGGGNDIVGQHSSDVQQKATASGSSGGGGGGSGVTEQTPQVTHANCHLPCNVDPTGIGDGLCDDDSNNCRCNWDGGDCDDPRTAVVRGDDAITTNVDGASRAAAQANAPPPPRRQASIGESSSSSSGDEGDHPFGREGDACDIAFLVNDRGALHAHVWEWLSGRAALTKNGPCRDAAASEEVLRTNLPALAGQMGDRTVVCMSGVHVCVYICMYLLLLHLFTAFSD